MVSVLGRGLDRCLLLRFVISCVVFAVCCLLVGARCLLPAVVRCQLSVVRCRWSVVSGLLFGMRCRFSVLGLHYMLIVIAVR